MKTDMFWHNLNLLFQARLI